MNNKINNELTLFLLCLALILLVFIGAISEIFTPKFIYKNGKAYKKTISDIVCINCCEEGKLNAK